MNFVIFCLPLLPSDQLKCPPSGAETRSKLFICAVAHHFCLRFSIQHVLFIRHRTNLAFSQLGIVSFLLLYTPLKQLFLFYFLSLLLFLSVFLFRFGTFLLHIFSPSFTFHRICIMQLITTASINNDERTKQKIGTNIGLKI